MSSKAVTPNPQRPQQAPQQQRSNAAPAESDRQAKRKATARKMALRRVPSAVAKIRLLAKLAPYKLTQAQADAIMKELQDAVAYVKTRLAAGVDESETSFNFPE